MPGKLRGWRNRRPDAPEPVPALPGDLAVAERAALVRTCIYVRDRVTSVALAQRLDHGLAEVGVAVLDPTGERFDPSRHEAAGTRDTQDPDLVGTVAVVEVPGYADRGTLVRAPVVTVYRAGS